jgi:hypothetical protein
MVGHIFIRYRVIVSKIFRTTIDFRNRRFGGTYRLNLQGRKIRERGTSVSRWLQIHVGSPLADFNTLKMEAIRSSETSVNAKNYTVQQSTWFPSERSHGQIYMRNYMECFCCPFVAYWPQVTLCDFQLVSVFLWVPSPVNFWRPEPILTKLGMYIMAAEPISTAYRINPSHLSACLYMCPFYHCQATALLSLSLDSVLGNGSVNT